MKKSKNRFIRYIMQTYPNFLYSINLSVDKVYNATNIFYIAILYLLTSHRHIYFDFLYYLYSEGIGARDEI
jgi:TRAP-type mannitol/chloroaromatic compound transport system permease small subunit